MPVIWGGIHPTVRPEECLKYADMVCIGEGELSLLELVDKMKKAPDSTSIEGIWFKRNGHIIKNPIRNLIEDIDSLPIEDLNIQDYLVLDNGKLTHVDQYKYYNQKQYSIFTARGCYYNCTYCANSYLKKLYGNKNFVRRRSVPHFIKELKEVTAKYDNIKRIWFDDDSFLIRPIKEFKLFKELYKKEINLPFTCLCTPKEAQKEKMELLISAGMSTIKLGIQSTTPRILALYKRPCVKEDILKANKIIKEANKGKARVVFHYDVILENPYETDEDLIGCLKFLMLLPPPFIISYFKLAFFPGMEITEKAKRDGILTDEMKNVYRKSYNVPRATYVNSLFYLMKFYGAQRIPGFVMTILLHKSVIKILNNKLTTLILELISKIRTRLKYEQ